MSQFPVEAGYFNKSDMVIPNCPLKQTIFGPSRVIRDDRVFEKLLNSYFKEIPGLPTSIIKCNLISNFFALRGSDMSEPGQPPQCMYVHRLDRCTLIVMIIIMIIIIMIIIMIIIIIILMMMVMMVMVVKESYKSLFGLIIPIAFLTSQFFEAKKKARESCLL